MLRCMAVESTIKVSIEVKHRLDRLKRPPRETYTDVIARLSQQAEPDENDTLTDEDIRDIEEALQEIKEGRTCTTEQVKRMLGPE